MSKPFHPLSGSPPPQEKPAKFYFPELDSLRFVAFLLVFIHHATPMNHPLLRFIHSFGWIGVDLFFALSAYLFVKLLSKEFEQTGTICIWKFYLRRALRIWPVYIVFCLLAMALSSYYEGVAFLSWRALGLFTFTDNILSAYKGYNPIAYANHLWTISYEEQFYLIIPLLLLFLFKSTRARAIITLASLATAFTLLRAILIWMNAPHPAIWVLPVTHFESILLGIIVGLGGFAFLFSRLPFYIPLTAGLFLGWLTSKLGPVGNVDWHLMPSYLLIGLSTSLTLYAVIRAGNMRWMRCFSFVPLVFLGKISYGLYVYHLLGLEIGRQIGRSCLPLSQFPEVNAAITNLASLLITVMIAALSYRFLEKPFLQLKKKFEVIPSRPP